jgi:hypothetical protein
MGHFDEFELGRVVADRLRMVVKMDKNGEGSFAIMLGEYDGINTIVVMTAGANALALQKIVEAAGQRDPRYGDDGVEKL